MTKKLADECNKLYEAKLERIEFESSADLKTLKSKYDFFKDFGVKVKSNKNGIVVFDISKAEVDSMEELLQDTKLHWEFA